MKYLEEADASRSSFASAAAIFAFCFAFAGFLPNPAIPLGGNTGLQISQIMALAFLPVTLMLGFPKRELLAVTLLASPVFVSVFFATVTGQVASADTAVKQSVSYLLISTILLPPGWLIYRGYLAVFLSGVAWGLTGTALVGAYQMYYWSTYGSFPLIDIYQNPSFTGTTQRAADSFVLLMRPFGLFPEPSAMTASVGPWLVLFTGLLLYPKLRYGMRNGLKVSLIVAVVSGVPLVIASVSGYAVILLVSMLLVALPVIRSQIVRLHNPKSLIVLAVLILVGVVIVYLAVLQLGSRVEGVGLSDESWQTRLNSIIWAFVYLSTHLGSVLVGVGPGQSAEILQSHATTFINYFSDAPIAVNGSVTSVVASYMQEMGLLGTLALSLLFVIILRAILRSSALLLGLSSFMAWLGSIILTTSYGVLSPIWFFFGVLLVWDRIFIKIHHSSTDVAPRAAPLLKRLS